MTRYRVGDIVKDSGNTIHPYGYVTNFTGLRSERDKVCALWGVDEEDARRGTCSLGRDKSTISLFKEREYEKDETIVILDRHGKPNSFATFRFRSKPLNGPRSPWVSCSARAQSLDDLSKAPKNDTIWVYFTSTEKYYAPLHGKVIQKTPHEGENPCGEADMNPGGARSTSTGQFMGEFKDGDIITWETEREIPANCPPPIGPKKAKPFPIPIKEPSVLEKELAEEKEKSAWLLASLQALGARTQIDESTKTFSHLTYLLPILAFLLGLLL